MSALDVAFAAAVVSPLAALLVAWIQARHQRQMRVYDELKAGYVAAIDQIIRKIADLQVGIEYFSRGRVPPPELRARYQSDKHFLDRALAAVMLDREAYAAFNFAIGSLQPLDALLSEGARNPDTDWKQVRADVEEGISEMLTHIEIIRRRAHEILT